MLHAASIPSSAHATLAPGCIAVRKHGWLTIDACYDATGDDRIGTGRPGQCRSDWFVRRSCSTCAAVAIRSPIINPDRPRPAVGGKGVSQASCFPSGDQRNSVALIGEVAGNDPLPEKVKTALGRPRRYDHPATTPTLHHRRAADRRPHRGYSRRHAVQPRRRARPYRPR